MPANVRAGIEVASPTTLAERAAAASQCMGSLGLTFPVLLDDLENSTQRAWRGWPARSCIVGVDGRVAWISAGGPQGAAPKELGEALSRLLGPPAGPAAVPAPAPSARPAVSPR